MGKEVLTLQFGSFANYVGAHYWNFQDEVLGLQVQAGDHEPPHQVDSSVLYRQGETLQGEPTYTPRLVLFDLSGSLGGASAQGSLYGGQAAEAAGVATWEGGREVHRAQPVPKSAFLRQLEAEGEGGPDGAQLSAADEAAAGAALEAAARELDAHPGGGEGEGGGGVRHFTDYLKAHLHPRTAYQLAGHWQGVTEFGGFGAGAGCLGREEEREEVADRIRFFAEECDSLAGVQVMVDDLSGWGGIAGRVLQEMRDTYGSSTPVLLFALRPTDGDAALPAAERRARRLSVALSASVLSQQCDIYVPVAPPAAPAALPRLHWNPASRFHSAAVCAAALDTATLPYRLADTGGANAPTGRADMTSLVRLLTEQHGTPLAALAAAVPCPPLPSDLQRLGEEEDARTHDAAPSRRPFTSTQTAMLTPGLPGQLPDPLAYAESIVLRGPRSEAGHLDLGPAGEALDAALLAERVRCVRQRTLCALPLPVPLPFPSIFRPPRGAAAGAGQGSSNPSSCPMLTRLAGTAAFRPAMEAALAQFRGAAGSAQGQATLGTWGWGREELEEVEERLGHLARAYEQSME